MDLFGDEATHDDDFDPYMDDGFSAPATQETLKPAQLSDFFVGHDEIEQDLLKLWQSGRMPHALVLNGMKGVGKATFAYRLARFILNDHNTGMDALFGGDDMKAESMAVPSDSPVFQRVASGGHADLLTIGLPFDEKKGEFKNEIPVDDIRKVAPFLRKTSGEGGWRIVIIDDANQMNRSGQNALLKILEEPPKKALLILVTHGAGGLLPTIRSRCRFVGFSPLSNGILEDLIHKSSSTPVMPNDLDILCALAQGSAGNALQLTQQGGIEPIVTILDKLNKIDDTSADDLDRMALAFGKSGSKDSLDQFLYVLRWWLDTFVQMAVHHQSKQTIGHIALVKPARHSLKSLLKLQEDVESHIKSCQSGNLDTRYMIFKGLRIIQNG